MDLDLALNKYLNDNSYYDFKLMLNYYRGLGTLTSVIDDACFGRSLDSRGLQVFSDHYWNTFQLYKNNKNNELNMIVGRSKTNWLEWVYNIRNVLLKEINYFEKVTLFTEIYDRLYRITESHSEFGELFAYDVSLRIGSYLKVLPNNIYLHAGAEKGYKSIFGEVESPIVKKEVFSNLLIDFEDLSPCQIENFLCVAKVNGWLK